jgi:hypothetical protein
MLDIQQLRQFLVKAKKATYAAGDAAIKTAEPDKSTTLIFEDGDFKYHDNYFGGEPFGGREVVFLHNKPVYIMTYYGWVDDSVTDSKEVYSVLQKALSLIPEDHPYRGPQEYRDGNLVYKNSSSGEIDRFSGHETICNAEWETLYEAKYIGGFVDR